MRTPFDTLPKKRLPVDHGDITAISSVRPLMKFADPLMKRVYHDRLGALRNRVAYNKSRGLERTTELWVDWFRFYQAGNAWVDYVIDHLALPAKSAKGVELAARLFSKTYGSGKGPPDIIKWFEANEARLDLLDQAAEWPERSEDTGVFQQGPFTVHDTVQASPKALEAAKDIINRALKGVHASGIPGLTQMAYGQLFLVGQIARKNWAAWYMPDKDAIYLRPGVAGSSNEESARHLIHEIGHRYWAKKLPQEIKKAWATHHTRKTWNKPGLRTPAIGEILAQLVNGKRVQVDTYDPFGRAMLVEVGTQLFVGSVDRLTLAKWAQEGDLKTSFPTLYAASGGPEEHFCESLSMYCQGRLTGNNLDSFRELVLKESPSSAEMAVRLAARFMKASDPCSVQYSFAWVSPDGTLHKLRPNQTHNEFAMMNIGQRAVTPEAPANAIHMAATATLLNEGWVRVSSPYAFEASRKAPWKAWQTALDLTVNCVKSRGEDPFSKKVEVDWVSQGRTYFEQMPVDDAVHKLAPSLEKDLYAKTAKYKGKREVPKADGNGTTIIYEYSDRQVQHRNRTKADRVEKLRGKLPELRKQFRKDLSSEDSATRLTALAVALIDATYERVGNPTSAEERDHHGVTTWEINHVKVKGGTATITYTGKSGVDHVKTVTDAKIVEVLKELVKGKKPSDKLLCDDDECNITAEHVNRYLKPYDITAKDLRGLHANEEVRRRLKEVRSKGGKLPADKKEREKKLKDEFKEALEGAAEAVGHEASTLKSQYLVPGMEDRYLKDGSILNKLDDGR